MMNIIICLKCKIFTIFAFNNNLSFSVKDIYHKISSKGGATTTIQIEVLFVISIII